MAGRRPQVPPREELPGHDTAQVRVGAGQAPLGWQLSCLSTKQRCAAGTGGGGGVPRALRFSTC